MNSNSVTDDYIPLIGNLEIWDRGDGIAEIADKSSNPSMIFMWIKGDRRLEFDDEGCVTTEEALSAFPGVIEASGDEGYHLLNGSHVQSLSSLISLIEGVDRGKRYKIH